MPAKTPYFYCGKCGFRNHPRLGQDVSKCEQCGEDRKNADSQDYQPSPAQVN